MTDSDTQHLWEMIWWGLSPRDAVVAWYPDSDALCDELQLRKEQLLERHQSDDFEKLERAFRQLNQEGVLSLHNAGPTGSESHSNVEATLSDIYRDVASERLDYDPTVLTGYCFYHEQDILHLVPPLGSSTVPRSELNLAFGGLDGADPVAVGRTVVSTLKGVGFEVDWSEDPAVRIRIVQFAWTKMNDDIDWSLKVYDDVLGDARKRKSESSTEPRFEIGETVVVNKAPYNDLTGTITSVHREERTVELSVTIFGRPMDITVSFQEVTAPD